MVEARPPARFPFEGEFPHYLSQIGAYENADPHAPVHAMTSYTPTFPLWSNGSEKLRAFVQPDNAQAPSPGDIPNNTLFFKTFLFDDQPIETRVIRFINDAPPVYASYRWDDEGSDAELLDGVDAQKVTVTSNGIRSRTKSRVIGSAHGATRPPFPQSSATTNHS